MSSKHLDAELIRKFKANHLLTPGGTVDAYLGRVTNVQALADGYASGGEAFGAAVDTLTDDVAELVAPTETLDALSDATDAVAGLQTDPAVISDYDLTELSLAGDAIAYGCVNTGAVTVTVTDLPTGIPQVTHIVFIPPGSGITSLSCDSSLGQYDNPLADYDPARMYVIYISRWVTGSTHKFVVTGRLLA